MTHSMPLLINEGDVLPEEHVLHLLEGHLLLEGEGDVLLEGHVLHLPEGHLLLEGHRLLEGESF